MFLIFIITYVKIDFMPTIIRLGPYRFYFYSHEANEPPHIHVDRECFSAKFWIQPASLASNNGFRANELSKLYQLV